MNPKAVFSTTHWSVILLAGRDESAEAREALEKLCRTYWYPIYAFLRRDGHGREEAEDLTQEFFAQLLKRNFLTDLDSARGRFRSFLLASLKHFLANESDRRHARKRGAGIHFISLEAESAEGRYLAESVPTLPSERLYERGWVLGLLQNVMGLLREYYSTTGRERLFNELHPFLSERSDAKSYAEVASRLEMKEQAVRVAVHRMRRRYGELLRHEIAHTVTSPADIDEEIRYLFSVISA